MTDTFDIGEATYITGRLSPMEQFYVAKRLVLVLAMLLPYRENLAAYEKMSKPEKFGFILGIFPHIAPALATISDEDAHFVLFSFLRKTQRQHAGGWADVVGKGDVLMFADMEFPALVMIAVEGILDQMKAYFPTGSPKGSSASTQA